jgi:hypothetical protein
LHASMICQENDASSFGANAPNYKARSYYEQDDSGLEQAYPVLVASTSLGRVRLQSILTFRLLLWLTILSYT